MAPQAVIIANVMTPHSGTLAHIRKAAPKPRKTL